MQKLRRRSLAIGDILRWADAYREATGKWPTKTSGLIVGAKFESWAQVDHALRDGLRGLPGGSSLAQLLAAQRGARNIQRLPPLTPDQILTWADAHQQRTGSWPTAASGRIPDVGGETWAAVNVALRIGMRGLPGGSSLARLLAQHRGIRNRKQLPPLAEEQILAWADAHHQRTGRWPHAKAGSIPEAPGETWTAVQMALRNGLRGLPGGSSLALLLAAQRGARNRWSRPNLALAQILAWADACHQRTGHWPHLESGSIPEAPGETWGGVNSALRQGARGLPGGLSLAELLAEERGARNQVSLPRLCRQHILAWADAHWRRTGTWPTTDSGPIPEAPGETWSAVDTALRQGSRGFRGGASLARLLAARGRKRNHLDLPPLTQKQILAWADAHWARTGRWPTVKAGPVPEAPGETWQRIDTALRAGLRGQPGGSSLHRLLVKRRGVRPVSRLPPLTAAQILGWAERHLQRTGGWPKLKSGPIADAAGETWAGVDYALRAGRRGLPGGSSLAQLLADQTGSRANGHGPQLASQEGC
jgi:hypothetical protein